METLLKEKYDEIISKSKKNALISKGRERLKKFSRKAFVKDFENIIFQKIN